MCSLGLCQPSSRAEKPHYINLTALKSDHLEAFLSPICSLPVTVSPPDCSYLASRFAENIIFFLLYFQKSSKGEACEVCVSGETCGFGHFSSSACPEVSALLKA